MELAEHTSMLSWAGAASYLVDIARERIVIFLYIPVSSGVTLGTIHHLATQLFSQTWLLVSYHVPGFVPTHARFPLVCNVLFAMFDWVLNTFDWPSLKSVTLDLANLEGLVPLRRQHKP